MPADLPLGPSGRSLGVLAALPASVLGALVMADAVPWAGRLVLGVATLALMAAALAAVCPRYDRRAPRYLRLPAGSVPEGSIEVQIEGRWRPAAVERVHEAGGWGLWLRIRAGGRSHPVLLDAGRMPAARWRAVRRVLLARRSSSHRPAVMNG